MNNLIWNDMCIHVCIYVWIQHATVWFVINPHSQLRHTSLTYISKTCSKELQLRILRLFHWVDDISNNCGCAVLKHVPQARQSLLLLSTRHPLSLFAETLSSRANVRKLGTLYQGENHYGLGADSSLPHCLSQFVQYGSERASRGFH